MKKKWFAVFVVVLMGLFVVSAVYGAQTLKLIVNGAKVESEVAPKIENGRTYVPLRVVTAYLNEDITWDGKTKTVTVHPDIWQQDLQKELGTDTWITSRNTILRFLMNFDERNDDGKQLVSKNFESNIVGSEVVIPIGGVYPNMLDYKFIDGKLDLQTKILTVRMKIWWYKNISRVTTWDISLDLTQLSDNNNNNKPLITKLWEIDSTEIASHTVFPGLAFQK